MAGALSRIIALRGAPQSIAVDNGTEFCPKAMDLWAYASGVHLDFIRLGRPVENGSLESFNMRLRDQCLNVEVFFSLTSARHKLELWREDYNHHRPHSALHDRTPAVFAAGWRQPNTDAWLGTRKLVRSQEKPVPYTNNPTATKHRSGHTNSISIFR